MIKVIKHPIYWLRLGVSFFILFPGFWIVDFGAWICRAGNKLQDLAVRIEGEVPEDDDYEAPISPAVRSSGQAVSENVVVPELSGSALPEVDSSATELEDTKKLVFWNEEVAPGIERPSEGVITFYDYESLWHFKRGDEIHYATKVETLVYVISHIEPANLSDFDKSLRKVTARRTLWALF